PTGAGEATGVLEEADAALLVVRDLLRVVVVGDHPVAVLRERRPVERRRAGRLRAPALAEQVGRAQQGLRRNAAPVRAPAGDQLRLDQRDALPRLHQHVDGDLAGRAGAEDDDVEALGHGVTVRNRTRGVTEGGAMELIDVTAPIRAGMPVYPGDPPVRTELA